MEHERQLLRPLHNAVMRRPPSPSVRPSIQSRLLSVQYSSSCSSREHERNGFPGRRKKQSNCLNKNHFFFFATTTLRLELHSSTGCFCRKAVPFSNNLCNIQDRTLCTPPSSLKISASAKSTELVICGLWEGTRCAYVCTLPSFIPSPAAA